MHSSRDQNMHNKLLFYFCLVKCCALPIFNQTKSVCLEHQIYKLYYFLIDITDAVYRFVLYKTFLRAYAHKS